MSQICRPGRRSGRTNSPEHELVWPFMAETFQSVFEQDQISRSLMMNRYIRWIDLVRGMSAWEPCVFCMFLPVGKKAALEIPFETRSLPHRHIVKWNFQ